MRHLRRTTAGLVAAGLALAALAGCAAPPYTYASDSADHAYFKVPASWSQVNSQALSDAQSTLLSKSAAGPTGGSLAWSVAYSAQADPGAANLLTAASTPVVYASVQTLSDSLRASLSFDYMSDLVFPVTPQARQEATSEGDKLTGFALINSSVITTADGVRGINELFEYDVDGLPDVFDQTVLTNSATTKLYLLLVQCFQNCFIAHEAQIKSVVDSFTVRGS
jgi:hypothetical protein